MEALDSLVLTQTTALEEDGQETLVSFDLDGFRYALTRRRLADDVRLSPREAEIIRLVANGLPNKCIGAMLDISAWTVATHLRRIFAKLGVNSRAAMIARVGGAAAQARRASVLEAEARWANAQNGHGKAAGTMPGLAQGHAGRAPA
ncbi:LuxR family transcriptional regulator [Roseomonas sp. KE2513]|nr:LuxR family transcriptional regulator [Roseomonas sp. KE2513]